VRVLIVGHRFPPDAFGGVERYTQALAAELLKSGDTVGVLARRPGGSPDAPRMVRERLPDGASVYRLAGGEVTLNRFLVHHQRLEDLFTMVMAETGPDVVHFNHLKDLSPRFVEIAHRLGAAVTLSLHDFYFACPLAHLQKRHSEELCPGPDGGRNCASTCFAEEATDPWLRKALGGSDPALRWGLRAVYFRRLLAMAERVVCYSRYVASYFEAFGADPARVRVLANAIPGEAGGLVLQGSTPKERGRLCLAYCGTVSPHKGVHVILDALRAACLGPVDLLVAGQADPHQPEYVSRLREQAATIGGLRLRLHGPYERADVPRLLQDVDCVIVPSLVPEAGPIVPREVLGCGVPVVVARLGALPEILAEGENGFTFDPARPWELAGVLRRLLQEEGLLARLREGARRTPVITLSDHAGEVRSVYQEAVGERTRKAAVRCADVTELRFLHKALIDLGFSRPC
jgi:glycosyltransferase involved in cell wall biosynthesis